jgi:hypothetical protein
MAKANSPVLGYVEEFKTWREDLRPYWRSIDKNSELYEFYKREQEETESQVSLNTPFSIVESMVAKANDTSLNITVRAKGENNLTDFESWVSSVLKSSIEDPDVAQFHGTFRKNKEKFFRDFLVKGNAVASVEWCYQTTLVTDRNGKDKKKTIADNPYVRNRDLKSVIFNPSRTLADSDVYYLESYVKFSDLQKYEKDPKTDRGYYTNLAEIKRLAEEDKKLIDDQEQTNFSDNQRITKKTEPIHLIERWEGAHLITIAYDRVVIRDEFDPFKIGGHNLLLGMNYAVGSRPYAYGEIDAIYGTVRAQDTIVNQNLDIVNRFLRPAILVDPTSGVDIDQLIILLENGGVMYGKSTLVGEVQKQLPPAQAFTTIEVMQQAIERAARFSPYASGLGSQATDKTQGTFGGIQALQSAAEPNFQVKLDALQDQFAQPMARMFLSMIAGLMGKNDVRYGLLQGQSPQWIKASRGVLLGSPTIQELITTGIITEQKAQPYIMTMVPTTDDLGNPVQKLTEIPGARDALIFDIDWLLDVKLDSQSAQDKQKKTMAKQAWVQWAQGLGVQFDPIKTATEIGRELDIEDPEEMYAQPQTPPMMPGQPANAFAGASPQQGPGNIGAQVGA